MNFERLFEIAMDRDVERVVQIPDGLVLNLGAGKKLIPGTIALDYPVWDADTDQLPYSDGEVSGIIAFHFLEHCKDPVWVLQECQRVLSRDGIMTICVPYYTSNMAHMELDHKYTFTEDTWKILFGNPYYDKNRIDWEFEIKFNMICGIVERNLCILTQLRKI